MDIQEFEQIKDKIETSKEIKSRAEGAKAKYEEQWKSEFKVNTIEEASELLEKIKEEIKDEQEQVEKIYAKLEKVTNWEEIE